MSLGLIGTLEMSKRALDTNRQGIEIAGHNLSNVSNTAYARQRLRIQTADTLPGDSGPIGTGSVVSAIEAARDRLLDTQITVETSVSGYLEARQRALEFGEVNLGQQIDRQSTTPEATTAANGISGQFGLAEGINEFFNSLQALATTPNSTADRQVAVLKAQSMAEKFNDVNRRLAQLRSDLNVSVQDDVVEANRLIIEISDLSKSITSAEVGELGNANDLRDRRQQKLEALAKLVNTTYSEDATTTALDLSIGGVTMIDDNNPATELETFPDGSGGTQVRAATGAAVTLTRGRIQGTISARDGEIATLNSNLNTLAGTLITAVNTIHSPGLALDGVSTGQNFFDGTDAATIAVNTALSQNPSLIQASANGDPGNNEVALNLAKLGGQPQAALGNLTFAENYNQNVANLGQSLANVNSQSLDQDAVNRMLLRQRDSLGGVSIDEEMANLIIFQRAFQASARMVKTLDELLQNVIALGV